MKLHICIYLRIIFNRPSYYEYQSILYLIHDGNSTRRLVGTRDAATSSRIISQIRQLSSDPARSRSDNGEEGHQVARRRFFPLPPPLLPDYGGEDAELQAVGINPGALLCTIVMETQSPEKSFRRRASADNKKKKGRTEERGGERSRRHEDRVGRGGRDEP